MLLNLKKMKKEVLVYCDLHGHSKKLNSFMYGCNTAANDGFSSWTKVRLFPRILGSLTPRFRYNDCTFRIEKSKLGTGRIVVWNDFGVTNSFTLESSLFGYEHESGVVKHYEARDLAQIGNKFCQGLY
jgi:hypothetical protein